MRARLRPELRGVRVQVQNMVCTTVLNQAISPFDLIRRLSYMGIQWCPMRIIALITRLRGLLTILLYRNGNAVVMGSKNPIEMQLGLNAFLTELRRFPDYAHAAFGPASVENIVCKAKIYGYIDLEGLTEAHQEIVRYDSDRFPGATIRHRESGRTTLITFSSGAMVVIGARRIEDARRSLVNALLIIDAFARFASDPPVSMLGKRKKMTPAVVVDTAEEGRGEASCRVSFGGVDVRPIPPKPARKPRLTAKQRALAAAEAEVMTRIEAGDFEFIQQIADELHGTPVESSEDGDAEGKGSAFVVPLTLEDWGIPADFRLPDSAAPFQVPATAERHTPLGDAHVMVSSDVESLRDYDDDDDDMGLTLTRRGLHPLKRRGLSFSRTDDDDDRPAAVADHHVWTVTASA